MMMPYHHQTPNSKAEEQALYDHFLGLVDQEQPQQLVDRFRLLFIEGVGYPDLHIKSAVERLVVNKQTQQNFWFILNRCCHILINRWQLQPTTKPAIIDLVDVMGRSPSRPGTDLSRSSALRQLREQVQSFVQSEHYQKLKRLALVVKQGSQLDKKDEPLGATIHRYPYLYGHCLLDDESSFEQQRIVRQFQSEAQQKLEHNLSQYITHQKQYQQLIRLGRQDLASRLVTPPPNPTLLPDPEFRVALQQFVGPVHNAKTCQDIAQFFNEQIRTAQNYASFKSKLYHFMTAAINPAYGQRSFNRQLESFLRELNQKSDDQALNEFLVVRSTSQLMNFLVIESPQKPQHFLFLDLINNLGPTVTTSMLLKLTLFCKKVKPYLEKRFAVLFGHYEKQAKDSLRWMVQVLENVNLALVTNFGQTNFQQLLTA